MSRLVTPARRARGWLTCTTSFLLRCPQSSLMLRAPSRRRRRCLTPSAISKSTCGSLPDIRNSTGWRMGGAVFDAVHFQLGIGEILRNVCVQGIHHRADGSRAGGGDHHQGVFGGAGVGLVLEHEARSVGGDVTRPADDPLAAPRRGHQPVADEGLERVYPRFRWSRWRCPPAGVSSALK